MTDIELLSGTVFGAVSSSVAAYGDPWEVYNGAGSTGLKPAYAVFANATSGPSSDVPASGVLAFVTFKTVNAVSGLYNISFLSDDLGITLMAKTSGPLESGVDYFLDDGTIWVNPCEPSSAIMGVLAALGMAAVGYRRYRACRAG